MRVGLPCPCACSWHDGWCCSCGHNTSPGRDNLNRGNRTCSAKTFTAISPRSAAPETVQLPGRNDDHEIASGCDCCVGTLGAKPRICAGRESDGQLAMCGRVRRTSRCACIYYPVWLESQCGEWSGAGIESMGRLSWSYLAPSSKPRGDLFP